MKKKKDLVLDTAFQVSNFEVSPPKCEALLLEGSMFLVNKKGRSCQKGIPLSSDMRNQVKELAQDHSFSDVGRRFHVRISKGVVSKIVKQYKLTRSTAPKKLNHVRTVPKCTFQDYSVGDHGASKCLVLS